MNEQKLSTDAVKGLQQAREHFSAILALPAKSALIEHIANNAIKDIDAALAKYGKEAKE